MHGTKKLKCMLCIVKMMMNFWDIFILTYFLEMENTVTLLFFPWCSLRRSLRCQFLVMMFLEGPVGGTSLQRRREQ